MKISMWNLADWLKKFNIHCFIKEGMDSIRTVRWMAGDQFDADVVYVCRDREILGTDRGKKHAYIVNRYDMIKIESSDTDLIFNEILTAIDYFNSWESNLNDTVLLQDGLQKMLDQSAELLGVPTFLYNTSGEVLAISKNFKPDIHWHWAELLKERRISDERFQKFKTIGDFTHVFTDKVPTFHQSAFEDYHYWHCTLFAMENCMGHLVCFDFAGEFPHGIKTLINTLVIFMQKHMAAFYNVYQPFAKFTAYLTRILDSQPISINEIKNLLAEIKWDWEHKYQVYVIAEKAVAEPVLLSRTYSILASRLQGCYTILYDKKIVIIMNLDLQKDHTKSLIAQLVSTLHKELYCSISNAFFGFNNFKNYYQQACIALEYAFLSKDRLKYAGESSREVINKELSKTSWLPCFAHEALFLLIHIDDMQKSEYYETLKNYIKTGFRISETARLLNIHRNTLLYRLHKISELIDADVFSLTEDRDLTDYLWISFAIIDAAKKGPQN